MHCLAGTFVKDLPEEHCPETNRKLYPVKIVLPPNKSRILYFDNQLAQNEWMQMLLKAMGFSNLFDFYEMGKTLGKGQFGLVKLATHKVTDATAAIWKLTQPSLASQRQPSVRMLHWGFVNASFSNP